jgi:hypothetical protein
MESAYQVELKRRRAITQSFTWKIALPFWKVERWIRALALARRQAPMHNFVGLPPRTEEVFIDLHREITRRVRRGAAPKSQA